MGHIGLAATTWVPMGAQVPVSSPTDHPNPFKGQRKGLMKNRIFKKISRGTERPIECENVSPHWQGDIWGGGGGRLGLPGVGTRDPRHGLGGSYTRKKFFSTQVQIHTQRPQYATKF